MHYLTKTTWGLLALLFLVSLTLPAWPVQGTNTPSHNAWLAPHASQEAFQQGFSFTAWWSGEYPRPRADYSMQRLFSTGANWISIIVTGQQASVDATEIDYRGPDTPSDDDLRHAINDAHALGLRVMLKPHVDLPNELVTGIWRGYIGSAFDETSEWDAWFASYTDFIVHYAALAQEMGVEQFCVGTELLSTTHRESDWRGVIDQVRRTYSGPLTYAALKTDESSQIKWWDAVDLIGVDSYYPISASSNPSLEELMQGWDEPMAYLKSLSEQWNRPIILTELGFRSHDGCASHPWDSACVAPTDLEEQALAYEATFRRLSGASWLAGMFWWQWEADPWISGIRDDGFSPMGKPAEEVLKKWYGAPQATDDTPSVADFRNALAVYRDGLGDWQDWSWGATVNVTANDVTPHEGQYALSAKLDPYGAISLRHVPLNVSQYAWLEFYVRSSDATEPLLDVYLVAGDGTELARAPVNDYRVIDGDRVDSAWRRVRVPFSYLNAQNLSVSRVNIQNRSGTDSVSLMVDGIQLLPAQPANSLPYAVFLPSTQR